jgi:hypothetical protein
VRYRSTFSLTLALDEGGWSPPRPGRFTPGKENRYPFYRRLGGPQGRFGGLRNISPAPGFDHRTFQPVASRYTDYAIPDHYSYQQINILLFYVFIHKITKYLFVGFSHTTRRSSFPFLYHCGSNMACPSQLFYYCFVGIREAH